MDRPLPWLDDLTRAKQPERLPEALTMIIQLITHAQPLAALSPTCGYYSTLDVAVQG